jgi:hypothetical protein
MTPLKSIKRASLRRSSFGLPRYMYVLPLLPYIVTLRGLASDFMSSISSAHSVEHPVRDQL